VAFCLGLRFAVEALRFFYFQDPAFCLRSIAFCLLQRYYVLPWKHCVLTSKILRFGLEVLRFVYIKDLVFYFGSTAFCLQRSCILSQKHCVLSSKILCSALEELRFVFKDLAFCLGSTAFIGDEIYSTVDACQIAQEMWEAIERLQQVNVQFLQQLQPEWSRFVTIFKQQHKLDEISYHKLLEILKQYQKEVNELHPERLARNANPLALVAMAQANQDPYYQTSKSHKSYAPSSKPSIPNRSHTTTRHKGKDIAKLITPPSETASEEDNNPEQAQRDKDMQNNLALIAKYFKKIYKPTNNNLRTSSNSRNKNVDTTPRYKNDNQSGQFGN
nr:hypothetical protein [Tanacetum cinerariifolium]